MRAYLVTGKTYPVRRELRAAGGLWSRDRMGYLFRVEDMARAAPLIERARLGAGELEIADDAFEPLTGEALRAYRQDRQERRRLRLLKRADAADKRAQTAHNRIAPHEREFLALGEPVKLGHHSARRHRKLIERADKAFMNAGQALAEAESLRRSAETLAPVRVKGDAETRRQIERYANAAAIGVGDTIKDPIFGEGVVVSANPKTFTVNYTGRGFSQTIDKSWATLVAKGSPENIPEPKFKAGQKVIAKRLAATFEGVIKRVTRRGYRVQYEINGRPYSDTFSEGALEPLPLA
ncbi:DUF3560 domain-containing protein (plasmid) [Methylocystis sp. MJC1]|uniref:DUF3560 domain-containing protein n=2 Tax=Methylocystis sp. MJC1 TaxID=2654282 RepID=UPI0020A62B37|nr:DUF3560 domain-containing protein [Methylocystis sp. MJC1]KAF2989307.1 hypothetical protein MJC1_03625 [Methylocystis sp. MJC1]UZX14196.1 DUF3560 domain-containing protein [Methylocystis sp. MJC1]